MVSAQIVEPPSLRSSLSTEVMTQCFTPISLTEFATRFGSSRSTANGRPVATAQNEHERVHIFPNIINVAVPAPQHSPILGQLPLSQDRKSTRLNSSHVKISYAVFCLKKK